VAVAIAIGWTVGITIGFHCFAHQPKPVLVPLGAIECTAYRAVQAECDSEPDIGAGGRVAINGVPTGKWFACNFLPFGTKIVIPGISGDTVWTCRDRMNKRLPHRIDLLIHKDSIGLGVRKAEVFIVAKGVK
jgi:hypothetical protein